MSSLDPDRFAAARRVAATGVGQPGLQRLTDLAATLLGAPSAQVAVVGEVHTIAGVAGTSVWEIGTEYQREQTLGGVTIRCRGPLVVTDARTDPRVRDLPPVRSGEIVSYLGVPLVDPAQDLVVGVLAVFGPEPRHWSEGDVVLLSRLSAPVVSELELAAVTAELEASRVRGELALDAASLGTFDLDLLTDRLVWDDRMLEVFGYQRAEFPGTRRAFFDRVHVDDAGRVADVFQTSLDTRGDFVVEYRVQHPDGEVRWVESRGRTLADESGTPVRMIGAAHDTTERRHADARVARVLESMPTAFFSLDRDWTFTQANAEAERLLGRGRDELVGGDIWALFPAAVGSDFEVHYRAAMESGQQAAFEAYYPPPLDSWYEVRAWPSPEGLSVYFLDVTQRRRIEEVARRDARRLALIARVSDTLSAALIDRRGGHGALSELMSAVVPELADWAIASLIGDDGRLHDVASWHRDPDLRPVAAQYARVRLAALSSTAPIVDALATGEVTVVPDVAAAVGRGLPPGEARDAYWQLDPATAVAVALVARGRVLGAMSLYRGPDREPMDAADRATLREVADRAALALDSAALHEQQRRMAEELQRSLLTAPPEPDHSQIVVRYVPAVQAAQVGGDWYDAFLQPGGATVVAIGDVVGHDTVAAAAMGQLRSLLRGIAYSSRGGPAAVLTDLDRAIEGLQVHTLATAAVARFEQEPVDRDRGETRLRWSSAGHPPLLVLLPDGRVEVLATGRADLMLGVDARAVRREQVAVLPTGSTVLLYTDGLVEGPDLPLDDGVAQLAALLAELGGLGLDELCDQVLARMRPHGSEDDVALVAVRLHREDRPRPAEAGPEVTPDTP
ncbi:Serine phosphatase RsbU, regulator of sigma subunit [Modestobacter italicus]|uniref:Serine phosphatase RsbU, regulator of sigma subunit n=1 Tax=Modestobacter italicus (strain DSM 44449 / CECT 9708 / BC 501) TaxID=2732864 RepID=I4EQ91_MODI5|nr:SpoIIE family protein phosphatase [Modestobacter marinus]CCH85554.1 Serine phosphatase RsbU, regulator of sigma subunit [Modestobacter marinus]